MDASSGCFVVATLAIAACAAPPPETPRPAQAPPRVAPASSPPASYPTMAPVERYREASVEDEVRLARSAAPPSVSDRAGVLVLGEHGYVVADRGTNGFVCEVERAWAKDFDDPEFWNPRMRAPNCYNSSGAESVLPAYLERTEWVLAGVPVATMIERTKAAVASNRIRPPEPGSMCFMMSRRGWLSDSGGSWHPHLMFFLPRTKADVWGANLAGSPLIAIDPALAPVTIFLVPVRKWSDGTADG